MKVEMINAFIKGVKEAFRKEVGLGLEQGEPRVCGPDQVVTSVTISLGISGDYRGVALLTFSTATAAAVADSMLGRNGGPGLDDDSFDALCELGNMAVGRSLQRLDDQVLRLDLSLPVVSVGDKVSHHIRNNMRFLAIPFGTDVGEVTIFISIAEGS